MPEQILVHPIPIASSELPIRSGAAIPPSFRDNLSLLPPVVVQLVFLPCVMVHALNGVSDSRIPKCVRTSHYADDAFGLVPNGTRELLHGMVHAFFSANLCQNMLLIAAQGNMQIRGPAFM